MDIEIISKESIKPSSPTPSHLKTFNLSILDQLILNSYVPMVLYYPSHNSNNILLALERALALKKSLSKTLTQFYPLAGTIKNELSIDCNDVGANYAIALARCRLNELLSHPDHKLLNRLLPFQPIFEVSSAGARVTNVQVNIFECGGIAIGLCISHRIVDGAALYTFLKGWTCMAYGAKEVMYPDLTAPSLFPAKDMWLREASMAICGSWIKEGKCVTKRFVFDSNALARLKVEATRNGVKNPTRVEVVTALIWKCALEASKQTCGFQKPSRLSHLVNLRRKLTSTVSKDSIGNLIWPATTVCEANYETTLHGLVIKVRESFSKIDSEFVNKSQGEKGYVAMQEYIKEMGEIGVKGAMDNYTFTSWCKMGFNQIDFGWGEPSWVTGIIDHGSPMFVNQVTLLDTQLGEGIEACVNLDEEEMEILRHNSELLAYASVDPSPLAKLIE